MRWEWTSRSGECETETQHEDNDYERQTLHAILVAALAVIIAPPAWAQPQAATDGLKPGDVLDKTNWQKAEGLLPPEILKHYQNGEYVNPIVDWPMERVDWAPDFLAGTEKNAGQYDVDEAGTIIEKGSGKQPAYIIGFPFPIIDRADPKAGTKVLWNQYYIRWYMASIHAESQLNWVAPNGLERRGDVIADFEFYDGVPEDVRRPNPDNLNSRFLAVTVSPVDLNGTSSLSWRYRDPGRARLDLGIRARPAAGPRGQPGQPIGRISRLGHEPRRRALLRWEDRGLHLDAEG